MRIPNWFVALIVVALVFGVVSVANADEAKGKVKSAEDGKVVVTDKDGKDWTFSLGEKAKVTVAGKEAKVTDLKKDAEVTVTFKKDGDKMVASEVAAK
jgi:hypothetical protein